MVRKVIIVGLVALLLSPLLVFVFRHPMVNTRILRLLNTKEDVVVSEKFSVKSEVPEYIISLDDVTYLEYVAENLGIFGSQAIVDPRIYRGFPELNLRYTATHVQFVLVPKIDQFLMAIAGKDDFAGRGDYSIEGDTLTVRVSLNIQEIAAGGVIGQFGLEDAFLRTAVQTLYYAHGLSDGLTNMKNFRKIQDDIKDYLYSGIFPWPIRIEQTK